MYKKKASIYIEALEYRFKLFTKFLQILFPFLTFAH